MKLAIAAASITGLIAFPAGALAHNGPHGGSLFEALGHLLDAPDHLGLLWVALLVAGAAWVIDAALLRNGNHHKISTHVGASNDSR